MGALGMKSLPCCVQSGTLPWSILLFYYTAAAYSANDWATRGDFHMVPGYASTAMMDIMSQSEKDDTSKYMMHAWPRQQAGTTHSVQSHHP